MKFLEFLCIIVICKQCAKLLKKDVEKMRVRLKALLAVTSAVALAVASLAGCETTGQGGSDALMTIVIGTHAQQEDDPNWVDEITGEPAMNPDYLRAAEKALAIVEEKLNVKITWSQYASDLKQLLLQTVLAGDPYCDLAVLWNGVQGNIMNQNILQPLDPYVDDVFFGDDDADKSWIPIGKTFGSYYLMNRDLLFVNTWPICYNIDYIEAVPALKENGRTVYPSDLFLRGEWTWSKFEDYLTKIKAYYNGKKGPVNSSNDIVPFNTNYSYAVLMAIASNGQAVYDGSNMSFDTAEAKAAIEYMDRMINSDLISCSTVSETSIDSGWLTETTAFCNGETVFTNVARWQMDNAGSSLASRGESMGIIPFPRPDNVPMPTEEELMNNSSQYRILSAAADSVGLMKGHDAERSKRALEAYATYKSEYYKAYGGVDSIKEYMLEQAGPEALSFGVDILHPETGDDLLKIFDLMGRTKVNDYSEAIDVFWAWTDIAGKSIYGFGGMPKYATAIEANKNTVYEKLDNMSKALRKGEVVDDIAPSASAKASDSLIFERDTNPANINWADRLKANDNVDGDYDIQMDGKKIQLRKHVDEDAVDDDGEPIPQEEWLDGKMTVDCSGVDFNTPGQYTDGIVVTTVDYAGNKNEQKFEAFVYDDQSTEPPTLVLKEELPKISVGTDTSTYNWGGNCVESTKDVNGIDLKSRVSADVTNLDVTVPGTYPVEIYVEDFAHNVTRVATELVVE